MMEFEDRKCFFGQKHLIKFEDMFPQVHCDHKHDNRSYKYINHIFGVMFYPFTYLVLLESLLSNYFCLAFRSSLTALIVEISSAVSVQAQVADICDVADVKISP